MRAASIAVLCVSCCIISEFFPTFLFVLTYPILCSYCMLFGICNFLNLISARHQYLHLYIIVYPDAGFVDCTLLSQSSV